MSTQLKRAQSLRADSQTPHRVGKWRLAHLIGSGRATRVFRARPLDRGEGWPADYAVKVAAADAPPELARTLLRNEAAACRAVSSPYIPALLETSFAQHAHLVFPFLAGGSLAGRMKRWGAAPPAQAFWILRQVLTALEALHQAGWTHGDIKPANIIVAADGHATLIDLGFAFHFSEARRPTLSMSTPAYTAPELHRGETPSPASDVYSLGVMAYELLCGQRPFCGSGPAELAEAHRYEPPPDIRQRAPQLSLEAAQLVKRLLAKDPAERPSLKRVETQVTALEIDSFEQRRRAIRSAQSLC